MEFQFNKQVSDEIKDRLKNEERKCFLIRVRDDEFSEFFKKDVVYVVSYLPENVWPNGDGSARIDFPDVFPLAREGSEAPPASCVEFKEGVVANYACERFSIDKNIVLDLISENTALESVNVFCRVADEYEV